MLKVLNCAFQDIWPPEETANGPSANATDATPELFPTTNDQTPEPEAKTA